MAISPEQEEAFQTLEATLRRAADTFGGSLAYQAITLLDRERGRGKDYVVWEYRQYYRVGPRTAFEADEVKKAQAAARKAHRQSQGTHP